MAARIRKGDLVEVVAGKYKGRRGNVVSIDTERNRVIVGQVNVVKRHQKPNAVNRQGGIVEKEAPIHLSNVMLVHDGERTRVGFREVKGEKIRWGLKKDEAIDG
jgi:large subunit ribosomal protein L24